MDHLFAELPGIAHTILNPGMFADNFLRTIDFAALLGIYPVLSGDAMAAPVSNEDIARAAVAVLVDDPGRHAGKTYRPTGPELLSATQMATVVANAVGHRVIPVRCRTGCSSRWPASNASIRSWRASSYGMSAGTESRSVRIRGRRQRCPRTADR